MDSPVALPALVDCYFQTVRRAIVPPIVTDRGD